MNIHDLEAQAEFLAMKQGLVRFATDRYKRFTFELRDRGFDEDTCRTGLEPARQLLRVDLIGTCGEVAIELNLEVRRQWAGAQLIVEERSPERYTYGTGPTVSARLGQVAVEIGTSYSVAELGDLGIAYDNVPRDSPFWSVKSDFDRALVFVARRLTGLLAELGWQGNPACGPQVSAGAGVTGGSDHPQVARHTARHGSDMTRSRPDLEID